MNTRKRILITWWGAFNKGGPTIGDLMSLLNVIKAVKQCGFLADVASLEKYSCLTLKCVDWNTVEPCNYDTLLFVCGPIIKGSKPFRELIQRFIHCEKIAVGVSVLPKWSKDYWNPFDLILAREGCENTYFDVALAGSVSIKTPIEKHNEKLLIGVCLRGHQREYGVDMCLDDLAKKKIDYLLDKFPHERINLETRLDKTEDDFQTINSSFSKPDIVITTRLHGALLAISHNVPVLALDQIKDCGKVNCILSWLGWKYVFPVKTAIPDQLVDVVQNLIVGEEKKHIAQIRLKAIGEANKTLEVLKTNLTRK